MLKMKENILVRALLMLCILMQCVAIMPHHHHGSSEVACINPLHCTDPAEGKECHGDAPCPAHNHSHDAPLTNCCFKQIVSAQPQREQEHIEVCLCDLHCKAEFVVDNSAILDVVHMRSLFAALIGYGEHKTIPL